LTDCVWFPINVALSVKFGDIHLREIPWLRNPGYDWNPCQGSVKVIESGNSTDWVWFPISVL